ncbi:MAG: DNA cytosine methyltransferase, partial [Acidobacteriota bacterium]
MIRAADLFCGAGGTSLGLARACEAKGVDVDLLAINHWTRAIKTHQTNHPWARHLCAPVDGLDPSKLVPGGELDLIVAGVECTHHSRARGGKPMSNQSRASAWHVLHWAERLKV